MLMGEIAPQDARTATQVLKWRQEQMSTAEEAHISVSYVGEKR